MRWAQKKKKKRSGFVSRGVDINIIKRRTCVEILKSLVFVKFMSCNLFIREPYERDIHHDSPRLLLFIYSQMSQGGWRALYVYPRISHVPPSSSLYADPKYSRNEITEIHPVHIGVKNGHGERETYSERKRGGFAVLFFFSRRWQVLHLLRVTLSDRLITLLAPRRCTRSCCFDANPPASPHQVWVDVTSNGIRAGVRAGLIRKCISSLCFSSPPCYSTFAMNQELSNPCARVVSYQAPVGINFGLRMRKRSVFPRPST
jgi:hypothetical protein